MPNVVLRQKNSDMMLVREVRDSAGRTDSQVRAMEQNDPKPPYITGVDKLFADQVREENRFYPKVLYELALETRNGPDGKPIESIPRGDRINPNYPMPYDLAVENGFHGQVSGHGSDKSVNVVYPYRTCLVPTNWDPENPPPIIHDECVKEEQKLLKSGWVDHPSKLKLPERVVEVYR